MIQTPKLVYHIQINLNRQIVRQIDKQLITQIGNNVIDTKAGISYQDIPRQIDSKIDIYKQLIRQIGNNIIDTKAGISYQDIPRQIDSKIYIYKQLIRQIGNNVIDTKAGITYTNIPKQIDSKIDRDKINKNLEIEAGIPYSYNIYLDRWTVRQIDISI